MSKHRTSTGTRPTPALLARTPSTGTIVEPPTSGIHELAITPETADVWLDKHNNHNRRFKPTKWQQYASDMRAGLWREPGESMICIANTPDGPVLINGQNRLKGVVESGVTIRFVFRGGYTLDDQDPMDTGAGRSPGDTMKLHDEKDGHFLAAIIGRTIRYRAGVVTSGGSVAAPSRLALLAYLEENPSVRRAAEVARAASTAKLPASPSVIGTCYHLCAAVSGNDAEEFFVRQVIGGLGLRQGDAALALRNRLALESDKTRNMAADDVFRYALMAWNIFRSGRAITKLQAPKGGWTAANCPEPK